MSIIEEQQDHALDTPRLIRKSDRRQLPDRRLVPRGGRRVGDVGSPVFAGNAPFRDRRADHPMNLPGLDAAPLQEADDRNAPALLHVLYTRVGIIQDQRLFTVVIGNAGLSTAVLQSGSGNSVEPPRMLAVEPGKQLHDTWGLTRAGEYDVCLTGPNGLLRTFRGVSSASHAQLDVEGRSQHDGKALELAITNTGDSRATVVVFDRCSRCSTIRALDPGEAVSDCWSGSRLAGWYELLVSVVEDPSFAQRWAGHLQHAPGQRWRNSMTACASEVYRHDAST